MKNKGITLIELSVVVSIIGILVFALGFSYVGWQGSYRVESEAKQIHADLMTTRAMASTRNRFYFADFNFPVPTAGFGAYRIAEDTNDDAVGDADADDVIDAAGHMFLPSFPKKIDHQLTWDSDDGTDDIIVFDRRGLVSPPGTIRIISTADPDYDCIIVESTRINLGEWNTGTGVCDAK